MKLIALSIALIISASIFAENNCNLNTETQVVASLDSTTPKTIFAKDHPKAKEVEWSQEGENWEVAFEEKGIDMEILYDAEGNILASETEIKMSAAPASVVAYVKKNYAGYQVQELVKKDTKGVVTFEVELKKKSEEIDLIFDEAGNFVELEQEDESEDTEENEE